MNRVTQFFANIVYTAFVVVAGICLYITRRFFNGGACKNNTRLYGKTVIVTGASSGIGAATALEMAKRGARVILACRNMLEGEKVASDIVDKTGTRNLVIQRVDLASFDSIRAFADRVTSQESRLDILINNADVATTRESRTRDGIELQFGTNHVGHFLLTMLLLDLLKRSTPSRIINVSSRAHTYGRMDFDNINLEGRYEPFAAYAQSKLANILFTRELARRLANTGVVCMSLHPGFVWTRSFRHMNLLIRFVLCLFRPLFIKSAYQGAQTTIHCAVMTPTPEMIAGNAFYFSDCKPVDPSPAAENDDHARRLWELSENLTGVERGAYL